MQAGLGQQLQKPFALHVAVPLGHGPYALVVGALHGGQLEYAFAAGLNDQQALEFDGGAEHHGGRHHLAQQSLNFQRVLVLGDYGLVGAVQQGPFAANGAVLDYETAAGIVMIHQVSCFC